jgi:putative transposase
VGDQRDQEAALRCLTKAIRHHGVPETIATGGSEANAAVRSCNEAHGTDVIIRPEPCMNNMIERDHRGGKRSTGPMLGFKSVKAAHATLIGIERMPMREKDRLAQEAKTQGFTPAEQLSSLAA